MKKLIFLFFPLICFFGCEVFQDDTVTGTAGLELDSNLFGNWKACDLTINEGTTAAMGYYYKLNLSSSGNFVYSHRLEQAAAETIDCEGGTQSMSSGGIWWIDGDHLSLSGDTYYSQTDYYVVSGNTLEFNGFTWEKL
tara:strand:+ start:1205 stop:1618 length:414 start_codon:yes stop_codon:yes gene_type:complete